MCVGTYDVCVGFVCLCNDSNCVHVNCMRVCHSATCVNRLCCEHVAMDMVS